MLEIIQKILRGTSEKSKLEAFRRLEKELLQQPGVRGLSIQKRGLVVLLDEGVDVPDISNLDHGVKLFTERVKSVNLLSNARGR
jgi:hypothetical protein